ncbi:C40 family peptidase [Nocardioides montaniterrae]
MALGGGALERAQRRTAWTCVLTVVLASGVLIAPPPASAVIRVRTAGALTTVRDAHGWLATFTRGSRTVTLRGGRRTLTEPLVPATVTDRLRVRLLPRPFNGTVPRSWLTRQLRSTAPDVLQTAFQYVAQRPAIHRDGLQVAGDAAYGPLLPDLTRAAGSDFNDYLGVPWTYGALVDSPELDQRLSLDCSGFVRMVLGYRHGFPLSQAPDGRSLPRSAAEMAGGGPGRVIVRDTGAEVAPRGVRPGDLLFFDADPIDSGVIDHVGIYLGIDSSGLPRFISSRRTVDGPTMSDIGGSSVLTGRGYYASAFREARRI